MPLRVLIAMRLLASTILVRTPAAMAGVSGQIVIVGNGPERPMIERLAQAFEKTNLGTVVTIKWDRNLKTVELVKEGQAHIVVTGAEVTDLSATPVAWDGIAVIVNFSNPVTEVTTQQVADLFTGKIRLWSELGGSEAKVELIH